MNRLARLADAQLLERIGQHAVVLGGQVDDIASPRPDEEVAAGPLADIAAALGHPLAEASTDELRGVLATLCATVEASGRLVGFDFHAAINCGTD